MKPWSETEDWAWLQVSFDSPFWKENDSTLSRTAGCLHFLRVSMMLSKTTLHYQNACTEEEKHVELLGNHQTEEKHILGHPICNSLEPMCNGFPFRTTPQVRANCFIQLLQGAMGLIFHMENLWPAEEKCFQKATTRIIPMVSVTGEIFIDILKHFLKGTWWSDISQFYWIMFIIDRTINYFKYFPYVHGINY